MKQNLFFNFGFVIVCMLALHVSNLSHENHLTIERAMKPMHHLSDARHYIMKSDYNHSITSLEAAISAMKIVEHHADSAAARHIEDAIAGLKLVEMEIKNDSVVTNDLNRAFFNALNAMAFANVTISEASLDKGEKYKAMGYMNASFSEMIGSLKFATDAEQKEMESKVIEDIRGILTKLKDSDYQYRFNYDSLNREIEELMQVESEPN